MKFKVSESGKTEIWTIDNIYVFDSKHLERLFNAAEVHPFNISNPSVEGFWNVEGIYVFHDEREGYEDKYYVGKSNNKDGINARLCDHSHKSSTLFFDKILRTANSFTIRLIKLDESGFFSTDALETAFIAYLISCFNGYNRTKGKKFSNEA